MDILLIILWLVLCILAIIGSLLPVLPGPLLAYAALILLQLTSSHPFGWTFFIIRAVIIIFLTILDYIIPLRWTKKFWWSKRGNRWSTIWLIIAVIILPVLWITIWPFGLLWLIWWPFLGAYIGEILYGKRHEKAFKSALGSFIGFLTWTFLKLIFSIVMTIYFVKTAYMILF